MIHRHAEEFVDHFVAVVLSHIDKEYPNKLDHVLNDATELRSPRSLHPIFFGSFDWHSSVHGHWLLIRALRSYPMLGHAAEVRALLDARFTAENVKAEVEYLGRPNRGTFERTYGWAWLLKMAAELRMGLAAGAKVSEETRAAFVKWDATLAPLVDAFVQRFLKYLPKATYPIRVGTHNNSAFALALSIDFARIDGNAALVKMIEEKAKAWYLKDVNYPAWEPDGTDFISPGLMEAECMRRMLPREEFLGWLERFFPKLGASEPATLFVPAMVSDRTDGQITHLDGLNLSRAWCWRSIANVLAASDPRREIMQAAHKTHLDEALPHVTGDYMGEHWLATFAMLALTE